MDFDSHVSSLDGKDNKLPQNCPDWVKISEIPHPALVPGFISRRECLPDGSFEPNTPSVSLQLSLLHSSGLSPSLVSVISNIPSGLMCESIHKKNLRSDDSREGFVITHSPTHYKSTSDPLLMPSSSSSSNTTASSNAVALANQTATELTALNILYGGVKGKAYLDSLKEFTNGIEVVKGTRIDELLRDKLNKSESVCGFKIFQYKNKDNGTMINSELDSSQSLIDQNAQLLLLLNDRTIKAEAREDFLKKLRSNLIELMKECPEYVKNEKFKGVEIPF